MFEDFIRSSSVRKVSPDKPLARSLMKMALLRLKTVEAMGITDENSFFVVENCYEAIRELSDALMALKGYKSYSHEANVEFLRKFFAPDMGYGNINRVDRYRRLRNDIKYEGLLTTKAEADDVLKHTKTIVSILVKLVEKGGLE